MGSTPQDGRLGIAVGLDELPQHRVYVKGFYIDKFEVTNARWKAFAEATNGYIPATWKDGEPLPGESDHPVTDTDWYDADAYCRWAGTRLPTEAEWEKAARGTDGRLWPWGNVFDPAKANTEETARYRSVPVGSYPEGASPYGVHDMTGNIWEWTSSWYRAYPGSTMQREAFGEKYHVLRGGSWATAASPFAKVTGRLAPELPPADERSDRWHTGFDKGFRCAANVR